MKEAQKVLKTQRLWQFALETPLDDPVLSAPQVGSLKIPRMELSCAPQRTPLDLSHSEVWNSGKHTILEMCYACGAKGNGTTVILRHCARCNLATYCSKECQKVSWKNHKRICIEDQGKGMTCISRKAFSNPLVLDLIMHALSFEFEIIGSPSPIETLQALAREPIFAQMDVIMEPCDVLQLPHLFEQLDSWDYIGVEGIFQIMGLHKDVSRTKSDIPHLMPQVTKLRNELDTLGMSFIPVVVLKIAHNGREIFDPIFPYGVNRVGRNMSEYRCTEDARHAWTSVRCPELLTSELGRSRDGVNHVINHINEHIRYDDDNVLKLRAPMRKVDKDIIIQCAHFTRSPQRTLVSPAAMFFNKIAREPVYDPIRCHALAPIWHIPHSDSTCEEAMSEGSAV